MSWRGGIALLVAVLCALALLAVLAWQQLSASLGIVDVELSGLRLDRHGLHLAHLAVQLDAPDPNGHHLVASGIRLSDWRWPLRPDAVTIQTLQLHGAPSASAPSDVAWPDLQAPDQWVAQLPRRLVLQRLVLTLPCADRTCSAQGRLHLHHDSTLDKPLRLTARVEHAGRKLALQAALQHASAGGLALQVQATLDKAPLLDLHSTLGELEGALHLQGSLAMAPAPEDAAWLQVWLADWLPSLPSTPVATPSTLRLGAGWALTSSAPGPARLDRLEGEVSASIAIASPWAIPGLGSLQGTLELSARRAETSPWQVRTASADLAFEPNLALLTKVPTGLRPARLALRLNALEAEESALTQLPLDWRLTAQGALHGTLEGRLVLDRLALEPIALEAVRGSLAAARVTLGEAQLRGAEAAVRLSGAFAGPREVALRFHPGTRLSVARLAIGEFTAGQNEAALEAMRLVWGEHGWRVEGPLSLISAHLAHSALNTQRWNWRGRLQASKAAQQLDGRLGNAAGLDVSTVLERRDGVARLAMQAFTLDLARGNPLATTLAAWPSRLSVDNGRLSADAHLTLREAGWSFTASAALEDGRGLYDRTAFSGLVARLDALVGPQRLTVALPRLEVEQLNPGVVLGPLASSGRYQAALSAPATGTLAWQPTTLGLFGGLARLPAGQVDLGNPLAEATISLQGISLGQLLAAYPAEGLSASGVLDGTVDVAHGPEGLSVEAGRIAAREDGVLRLRSPGIRSLAQRNTAMRLVAEALDDFRFHHLSSDVAYAADGDLSLGLRLEGRNPALEGGRPINLNVNLEENIPALLTSLQLSDRVSETVRQRVRERLERGTEAP